MRTKRTIETQLIEGIVSILAITIVVSIPDSIQPSARNSSDQPISPIPRCIKFPDKDRCYTLGYTNVRDKNVQLIMEQVKFGNLILDRI